MARAHGHGNPPWTRDETILALELYFDLGGAAPPEEHPRVRQLSALLQQMPFHDSSARKGAFRNPAGVAFKLQNLRHVATGKGLGNVSQMDRNVWAELGTRQEEVKRLAQLIRSGIQSAKIEGLLEDDSEFEFLEGRIQTALHIKRERSRHIRRLLLKARAKTGRLACDMCDSECSALDSELREAMFEAHHVLPISATAERITRAKDVALLCANCHRILHRAIGVRKRWIGIEEGRLFVKRKS